MTTLNDEILRATGGPTVNDGLRAWYSALPGETLQDAELRWLLAQVSVIKATTINDAWIEGTPGPGTIDDRQLAYWSAQ